MLLVVELVAGLPVDGGVRGSAVSEGERSKVADFVFVFENEGVRVMDEDKERYGEGVCRFICGKMGFYF